MPSVNESKKQKFISTYLDSENKSNLIKRDNLVGNLQWTSGDGLFRMDTSSQMREYKYCYFSKKEVRFSWNVDNISENLEDKWCNLREKYKIYIIYKLFTQTALTRKNKDNKSIGGVKYLQFYGKKPIIPVKDQGIREDIRRTICSQPCCVCFRIDSIECDHKNDLKNDPRVLDKSTQTLDDFQPLCKHCNMLKKSASQARNKTNKRIGATKYGYSIDFITGNENFDRNDPNWYKGTYWGDVREFKKSLRK